MTASKTTTQRKAALAAVKSAPPGGDYVWDGVDEDERPLTHQEMQNGIGIYRNNTDDLSAHPSKNK